MVAVFVMVESLAAARISLPFGMRSRNRNGMDLAPTALHSSFPNSPRLHRPKSRGLSANSRRCLVAEDTSARCKNRFELTGGPAAASYG